MLEQAGAGAGAQVAAQVVDPVADRDTSEGVRSFDAAAAKEST